MSGEITHSCVIERKQPDLPRFVVIPSEVVAEWDLTGTTVLKGTLDGVEFGRRTIQRWDADRWFIGIPETLCRKAGVDTGSRVKLILRIAPDVMPVELAELLARDARERAAWDALTKAQQRMLRENVAAAKQPETRRRRADRELRRG